MDPKDESSARGFKHVLTMKRGSRDDNSSIASDTKSPIRNSTDSVGSKIISRITNNDDEELSDGKKPKKLIPGLAKLKDRKRRKSQAKAKESLEELRGRNGIPKTPSSLNLSPSSTTLNDEHSSLLTSDSEEDL
jgi:hypothetical protein